MLTLLLFPATFQTSQVTFYKIATGNFSGVWRLWHKSTYWSLLNKQQVLMWAPPLSKTPPHWWTSAPHSQQSLPAEQIYILHCSILKSFWVKFQNLLSTFLSSNDAECTFVFFQLVWSGLIWATLCIHAELKYLCLHQPLTEFAEQDSKIDCEYLEHLNAAP